MRKPEIVEKTRGWEALSELLETMTQVDLAAKTGLKQSAISLIVNLRKKPNLQEGIALEKVGILVQGWTQPPRARRRGAA